MNKAIEKASGDWINFMNAGDSFNDKQTVSYVMLNKSDNTEMIYGNHKLKGSNKIRKAFALNDWYFTMPFCHQTLFVATHLLKTKPFDTDYKLAADYDFIINMLHLEKKFEYIDKTLAIFMLGGIATSNKDITNFEAIKVLIKNNVSQEEIEKSIWYKRIAKIDYIHNLEQTIINREKTIKGKEYIINKLERESQRNSANFKTK